MTEINDITIVNINEIDTETRTFIDGSKRSITRLPSIIIGYGVYNPGWKWSVHASPQTGKESARHIGWIKSGKMTIGAKNGTEKEVGPGDFFEIAPGHDAWVTEDKPCIALDFEYKSTPQ